MRKNSIKRRIADNFIEFQTTKTRVVLDNYYTNRPITIQLNKADWKSKCPAGFKRYQVKEAVKHGHPIQNPKDHFLSWRLNGPFSASQRWQKFEKN